MTLCRFRLRYPQLLIYTSSADTFLKKDHGYRCPVSAWRSRDHPLGKNNPKYPAGIKIEIKNEVRNVENRLETSYTRKTWLTGIKNNDFFTRTLKQDLEFD